MKKTIVLIHGAWMTPASLANFRHHYEAHGYPVLSPAWPLMDRSVAELRATPHPQLGELTLGKIVDHYAAIIETLPEKPILIGHSYGGLIVQMLLDRGYGVVGVSIAPAPAARIVAGPKALWSALPVFLAWRGWTRPLTMTRKHFAWSMGNTLSADAQRRTYEEHVVPAPGRIYYQSVLGIGCRDRIALSGNERAIPAVSPPFRISVPQAQLDDLQRRLNATRWPDRETVSDASQGAQLERVQAVVEYWGTRYDWRKTEARLNAYPQYLMNINGVDIHFVHVRSPHANALPLLVTHGWPGSIIELMKVIDQLTNPTKHGGSASDAFHLVLRQAHRARLGPALHC
jgi:pimeloyl-ACP methyl ester carboxylesterase